MTARGQLIRCVVFTHVDIRRTTIALAPAAFSQGRSDEACACMHRAVDLCKQEPTPSCRIPVHLHLDEFKPVPTSWLSLSCTGRTSAAVTCTWASPWTRARLMREPRSSGSLRDTRAAYGVPGTAVTYRSWPLNRCIGVAAFNNRLSSSVTCDGLRWWRVVQGAASIADGVFSSIVHLGSFQPSSSIILKCVLCYRNVAVFEGM